MKKLTLFGLLAAALVIAALPALSQTSDAGSAVLTATVLDTAPANLDDLFPAAEILGTETLDINAAAGGGSGCYYTCSCNGTPLRCCTNASGGVSCKTTDVIQCPQVNNC